MTGRPCVVTASRTARMTDVVSSVSERYVPTIFRLHQSMSAVRYMWLRFIGM